jgi:hypothetical protein
MSALLPKYRRTHITRMAEDVLYNATGFLAIASVSTIVWYFCKFPNQLTKFKKDFQDALDEGRGPPQSPA